MPGRPANSFRSLAGVPVLYDRQSPADYGKRGIAVDFHVPQSFEEALDACFAELWNVCPLGRADTILSAGTYANRPGSQHSWGKAMDIDAILWPQRPFVTLDFPTDKVFYTAVEAVLRRHFDYVLTYLYNAAHHDHFHVDQAGRVGFGTASSKTYFVQSLCHNVLGLSVGVDGQWGPETAEGLEHAQRILGVPGDLSELQNWLDFLQAAAERAFFDAISDPVALSVPDSGIRLAMELAGVIEDGMAEHPLRKHALSRLQELADRLGGTRLVEEGDIDPSSGGLLLHVEEEGYAGATAPPSKLGRQLARTVLWDAELLIGPAEARAGAESGWHSKFEGREWRYDGRGVYIREFENGEEPLRTLGEPVTCRRIWELFKPDILQASQRFGVSPALIIMTIATETAVWRAVGFTGPRTFYWEPGVWNRDVQPPFQGDYSAGPMQTLATTARWVIRAQQLPYDPFRVAPPYRQQPRPAPANHPLYDPNTNITVGAAEIKQRWNRSGDDPILVAACFNAGGLYETRTNAWHLRSTNDHLDRAARWFGDACAVLAEEEAQPNALRAASVGGSRKSPQRGRSGRAR